MIDRLVNDIYCDEKVGCVVFVAVVVFLGIGAGVCA